ncbi:MAG: PaaI family thioesterase [bacterium]|nr:PaaI family thioesterase [bacterium]
MPKEVVRYNHCFVCGPDNPIGLNLKFLSEGNRAWTEFQPDRRHEGYKGILHGGIIGAILDEVMIKAALAQGIICVTASMEIRYKAPANLTSRFHFEAFVTKIRGRIIETSGLMTDETGKLIAESTAKYMTVTPEMQARLNQSLSE